VSYYVFWVRDMCMVCCCTEVGGWKEGLITIEVFGGTGEVGLVGLRGLKGGAPPRPRPPPPPPAPPPPPPGYRGEKDSRFHGLLVGYYAAY